MTLALSRNWEFSTGWQRSIGVHWMFDSFTQAGVSSNTMLVYPSISFSRTRRGGMMPYWGDTQRCSIDTGTHYLGSDVDFIIMQAHGTLIRTPWRGHRFVVRGSAGKIKDERLRRSPARPAIFAGGDRSVRGYKYESISPRDSEGRLTGASLHGDGQHRISVQPHGQVVDGRLLRRGRSQQQPRASTGSVAPASASAGTPPWVPSSLTSPNPSPQTPARTTVSQFYIGLGAEL